MLPPVTNDCCAYARCWAQDETDESTPWFGPCWGSIEVIDEDYWEEDWDWIHGCEGHRDRFGQYILYKESREQ